MTWGTLADTKLFFSVAEHPTHVGAIGIGVVDGNLGGVVIHFNGGGDNLIAKNVVLTDDGGDGVIIGHRGGDAVDVLSRLSDKGVVASNGRRVAGECRDVRAGEVR